ncbi:unnamed protein product [Aureobasidium pullulans]|nr:unnamed protein product [Aureobasidium pullulans]
MSGKLTQSPGERAKLVLVNETSNLEPRPLYKEVARGRGVVRGHRQERSDVLPLRSSENLRASPATHEKQRSLSSNPGRQRSMVAQELYSRPRDAISAETLQPAMLQPMSYEAPRKTSISDLSEKLGPRIMARKNSRDEAPMTIRKSSRDESIPSSRKGSRDESFTSTRKNSVDEVPEPLKVTPRLQLTTVPEARDESIMERGRPISRRDSKRGHSVDPFSGGMSPRSHSAAPTYTLPQTCYAPSGSYSVQPSPSKTPTSARPSLHSSASTPAVPRLPSIQQSLSAPNTARPTFHPSPSISARPSLQASPWQPEHPRKDSLDPLHLRTEGPFRVVRALHLVELDSKIDACMHSIMERQRKKTKLVDGLPEVQEMDKAEELKEKIAAREAEANGVASPVKTASSWAPRESSLNSSVQANGLLSPPPSSKAQQRGTITYSAIFDFLDEFD